jgi:hypothetical protein
MAVATTVPAMSLTHDFVPGIELCRRFYFEAVRPVLDASFPGLRHAAALIGPGSEVLGFDTPRSTDHHWGPRAMLFLPENDAARCKDELFEAFRWQLPHRFLGYPTNFAQPVPEDPGTRLLQPTESGPIDHRIEVFTVRQFVLDTLGFDIRTEPAAADWLAFPQQKLRALTTGAVYHDEAGLQSVRQRFATYPHDVWLYLLASGWARIGQEEHLMGRAGEVGDELGSAIIASRLVRDAMNLCFLMERQYAPYPKWFGTAFMRLNAGPRLAPLLQETLQSDSWPERDDRLARIYEFLAEKHNLLGLTDPLPAKSSPFWGRPFNVIHGDRFAEALRSRITDAEVARIAGRGLIGSIDQISDNTDVLDCTPAGVVKRLYQTEEDV